jgi:hypothetical protein
MMDEILMDADGRMCGGMLSLDEARAAIGAPGESVISEGLQQDWGKAFAPVAGDLMAAIGMTNGDDPQATALLGRAFAAEVALECAKAKIATLEDKLAMEERVSRESLDALALTEERGAYWQNRALAAEERLTRKDAPLVRIARRG